MKIKATSFCSAAVLVAMVPDLSSAQAPETETELRIEEIVVTARRVEESLQNVPVAVTALSAADLEQKHLKSTEDLRAFVPSLNVSGQRRNEAQFFLRGQGPGVINAGQRNFTSVATYFAEVPATVSGPGVFFDLANVQVLKGPQGTLFGRNTTGGAVLFTPAKPTQDFEGYVKATGGNYNNREVEAVVNIPLIADTLAVRLSGNMARRDGFTDSVITGQDLDDRDYDAWRVSVLWTPTADIENTLIVDGRNINQNGTSAVIRAVNPNTVLSSVPIGATSVPLTIGGNGPSIAALSAAGAQCRAGNTAACVTAGQLSGQAIAAGRVSFLPDPLMQNALAQQQALGVRKILVPSILKDEERAIGAINTTVWNVTDELTLKNIVAFRRNRSLVTNDYDGTPLPLISQIVPPDDAWNSALDQYTEEFQIQRQGDVIDWLAGYYYEYAKPKTQQQILGLSLGTATLRVPDSKDTSTAVFAHGDIDLGSLLSGLSLSGGARYTRDQRQAAISTYNPTTGACILPGSPCPFEAIADFDAVTWDVSLNKKFENLLVYAAVREGFKSGGFNLPAPDPSLSSFDPETVSDIEVGLKTDWELGSVPVRLNVAGFYDKYEDIQVITAVPVNGQLTSLVTNNGKATIKGGEVEFTLLPIPNLQLSGFYSYTKGTYDKYIQNGVDVSGRQLFYVPKSKAGGAINYSIDMGALGGLNLGANVSYTGEANSPDVTAPPPINKFESYTLVNVNVDWVDIAGLPIDLTLFGTNVTDEEYTAGGYPIYAALGFSSAIYGEPRMYGASLRYRFGK